MKCPFCGHEGSEESFKLLREPWKYRFYTVKRFECSECRGIFRHYSGVSPKGKKSEFFIREKPRIKSK